MRFFLLSLLVLSLAACDSDGTGLLRVNVSEMSHDPADLVGTWELIAFTALAEPRAPVVIQGGDAVYVFGADGTVEVERRGTTEATTWSVPDPARATLLIGDRREYFGIAGDRLYFDDRPKDGSLQEFARR